MNKKVLSTIKGIVAAQMREHFDSNKTAIWHYNKILSIYLISSTAKHKKYLAWLKQEKLETLDCIKKWISRNPNGVSKPVKNYNQYIQSKEWRQKRQHILQKKGKICQSCKSKKNLHVHHGSYQHIGAELDEELYILCSTCHALVHKLHDWTKNIVSNKEFSKRRNELLTQATHWVINNNDL